MIRSIYTLILSIFLVMVLGYHQAFAQGPGTPIPVNPPTATPTGAPLTEVPTPTATAPGPAVVEARSAGTNVRAQPDINSERIGQIFPGTDYVVVAKRFNWYEIQFPDAPTGIGWVYNEVVQLKGDPALVPELGAGDVPTENPAVVSGRETLAAISATPGAIPTLTAMALITPTGLFSLPQTGQPGDLPQANDVILPTFTFPPFTATPVNIQDFTIASHVTDEQGGLPPVVPIAGLIGLGLLGIVVSILRRL